MIELNIEPKDLSIIIDALEHYHWNMGTDNDDRDRIDGLTQSLEKLEKA